MSMPYACIGDGSLRLGEPEFIVYGLVGSSLSLSLSALPAFDDLVFSFNTFNLIPLKCSRTILHLWFFLGLPFFVYTIDMWKVTLLSHIITFD